MHWLHSVLKTEHTHSFSHMKWFLTKCILSLLNWVWTEQITVLWRFTNSDLFAFLTNTVNWSITPVMSLGQNHSSNKVRLYHDWFYLQGVKFNFQCWCQWKQVSHLPTRKAIFTVRGERIDLLALWYWTYLQR